MGERYLVTGGAGFIGSHVVEHLIGQGKSVRVLDDFSTGRKENIDHLLHDKHDIEIVREDFRQAKIMRNVFKDITHVVHLGALPSVARSVADPIASNEVNINGTLNLLEYCREHGIERFVFASSSSVYGNTPTLPKHEGMPPSPLSPYALQKYAGERYCQLFHELYGVPTVALRFFNVFGPRQNPDSEYSAVIPIFIRMIRAGEAPVIFGDGKQTRDFTYVDNVVHAIECALDSPEKALGEVYNVACGKRFSLLDTLGNLNYILGKRKKPIFTDPRPGDVRDSFGSNEKISLDLGWVEQTGFLRGLEKTAKSFERD